MTERLLTAREVADRLGLSIETVLRWAARGEFEGVVVYLLCRAIRFREDELEAWLDGAGDAATRSATHHAGRRPAGTLPTASSATYHRRRGGTEMPRLTTGSVYRTADGYGIRWPEDGSRPQRTGFATKTEARRWFAENVAPPARPRRAVTRHHLSTPSSTSSWPAMAPPWPSAPAATLERAARPGPRARSATGRWPSWKGPPPTSPRWRASLPDSLAPPAHRWRCARRSRAAVALALPGPQPGRRRRPQPGAARARSRCRSPPTSWPRSRSSSARSTGRSSCSPPRLGCGRTSGSALERRDLDRPARPCRRPRRVRRRRS